MANTTVQNPYVGRTYKETPWQSLLSHYGIRTQADAWQENMAVQAAEFDSAYQMKLRDEEYNLPVNQVARMRAAGLNPDIEGGKNLSSGEAQPMPEDPSTPMQSTGNEVGDFANNILGLFSTAIGMSQGIQGVVANRLSNTMQSLQNESFLAQFAEGMFPYFLPNTPDNVVLDDGSEHTWKYDALQRAKMFAGGLPQFIQNRFIDLVQGYWNSVPGDSAAWSAWHDRVTNRKGYFNESSTFYDEADDVLRIISDELGSLQERVVKSGMKAETAENENSEEYFNALDATQQAEAENATNRVTEANMDMTALLREHLDNIIQKLDKASKDKGWKGNIATIMMSLLSVFQLYISTQGAPSVSRSSSVGPKGVTNSQTLSF